MMINRVVLLLQSHSRKQTQKHMFSKYMYFNFAKYRLFNQLIDYEDGEGGRDSDDFFFNLFILYMVYCYRAMNNTLSRFLKSGSAGDSFTQRSDHSHMALKMLIYI